MDIYVILKCMFQACDILLDFYGGLCFYWRLVQLLYDAPLVCVKEYLYSLKTTKVTEVLCALDKKVFHVFTSMRSLFTLRL